MIGLFDPILLIFGNKNFGISSTLRHICAMCAPMDIKYFKYNWKGEKWSLFYVVGIAIGGFIASNLLMMDPKVEISKQTITDLMALGVTDFSSYLPGDIFSWKELLSFKGLVFMVIGGFLVGFGTRYANGCTSGHSISGLSNLQFSSLVATISFFAGGLIMTHFFLPIIL
jgi:uncharacterized membrane protein YedE/YeeE